MSISDKPLYWQQLPALRHWLIEVARNAGTPGYPRSVTYGEAMRAFGLDRFTLRHALARLGREAQNNMEPIITALVVRKDTRRCSVGLAKEFGVHDDRRERSKLYKFWGNYSSGSMEPEEVKADSEAARVARFVSVEARPDQAAFRRRIFVAFNGKCAISGCDIVEALDAAHKEGQDWRRGHNRAEDGYLLRKDLHALYDRGLLRISDEGIVKLEPAVMGHYAQFAGTHVKIAADGRC